MILDPETLTLLKISGIGIPLGAARGLSQTLEPIQAASQPRRTINGDLQDLSLAQFRKYRTTITCQDQAPLAFAGIWPGQIVVIDSALELVRDEYGIAGRPIVPGSERQEGAFVFFRPRLTMMVIAFNQNKAEWAADVGWNLEAEEV